MTGALEDRRELRAVTGVALALLAVDWLAFTLAQVPGGQALSALLLAIPASAVAADALPAGLARRRLAAALLGGLGAALALALWVAVSPPRAFGVAWAPDSLAPNLLDDLTTALQVGETVAGLLLSTLLGALAAAPLAAARGVLAARWCVAAGVFGACLLAGPLVVADPQGASALGLVALAGLQLGVAAWLLAPAPPLARTSPGPALSRLEPGHAPGLVLALAAAVLACGHVAHALRVPPTVPNPPLEVALQDCQAALERQREQTGRYPTTLAALPGLDAGLAGGLAHGYLVRYATHEAGARYVLVASPALPGPGQPAYRAQAEGPLQQVDGRGGLGLLWVGSSPN